ncbi:MAG: class I SAM-dependent methyltransferase [Candidatus Woesearchaeota archaeon]
MYKTEFFESAVKSGFYGLEKGNLYGKRDNVRKYWEDMSIKQSLKPYIKKILQEKGTIKIADMGCGSGEGIELLTRIPHPDPDKDFLLAKEDIEYYYGFDISPSMIEQGLSHYKQNEKLKFIQADLSKGLPNTDGNSFDLYFSSYSPLSHLTVTELSVLTEDLLNNIIDKGVIVYDLFARYSPEWPIYWDKSNQQMLKYNMAYLLPPEEQIQKNIENYNALFWSGKEFKEFIGNINKKYDFKIDILMKDRSIFVGRHMDTGIFNNVKNQYRLQVNKLFDRDFRGNTSELRIDTGFIEPYKKHLPIEIYKRIDEYKNEWNGVINLLEALMGSKIRKVNSIIHNSNPEISEELSMLKWLYDNASRFPVKDFWASIMGPQIACVLRNYEFSMPEGVGCGHGLVAIVEVDKTKKNLNQ